MTTTNWIKIELDLKVAYRIVKNARRPKRNIRPPLRQRFIWERRADW